MTPSVLFLWHVLGLCALWVCLRVAAFGPLVRHTLDCFYPTQLHIAHFFLLASVPGAAAWLVSNRRHQLYWVLLRLGTNRRVRYGHAILAITCLCLWPLPGDAVVLSR